MDALLPDVDCVTAALEELNECTHFVEFLKLVLAVGNYMNGGSFRGGAAGFKLDTLRKLQDVRSTKLKGKTLLDFLAKLVVNKHPAIAEGMEAELQNVGRGTKVAFSNISTQLAAMQRSLKASHAKMESMRSVDGTGAKTQQCCGLKCNDSC